jgi:hypothetical protein
LSCATSNDGNETLWRSVNWIFGTRPRNTIHCSKIHFFWHRAVGRRPVKQGSFARGVFQKTSNLRLHSKVPKLVAAFGKSER